VRSLSDFKVGDRIFILYDFYPLKANDTGTIVEIESNTVGLNMIGVEFDFPLRHGEGHTCEGKTKNGHGYYTLPHFLEKTKTIVKIKDWLSFKK
jgi:hypothetical protein